MDKQSTLFETLFPIQWSCFMLHITKAKWLSFPLSLKGNLECVKCGFCFFGPEVSTDSFNFMDWIMGEKKYSSPGLFFVMIILILSVHIVFPSSKIKHKPWLNPQPCPFLQVCFSFPSVTFSTPVAGAMAEVGTIFWRCGIGRKLVWNSVVLGVGLRWMDRTHLARVKVSVRVRERVRVARVRHLSAGRLGDKTIEGLMVVKQYGGLNPSGHYHVLLKWPMAWLSLSGTHSLLCFSLSLSFFSPSLPHIHVSFLSLAWVQTSSSLPWKAN